MNNAAVWITLFALGLLGFNWPILEIFHESLYEYLLVSWLIFLVLVALAARGTSPPPER